ncbi:MAG: hypothetical protein ABL934_16655 [Lysobacteraceae bacterium]
MRVVFIAHVRAVDRLIVAVVVAHFHFVELCFQHRTLHARPLADINPMRILWACHSTAPVVIAQAMNGIAESDTRRHS